MKAESQRGKGKNGLAACWGQLTIEMATVREVKGTEGRKKQ